jgi:hypothetical protein
METLKQKLAELIEAYGAARSTNNSILIGTAGNLLSEMLQNIEIAEADVESPE